MTRVFGDISDEFEFDEDSLVYNDAPLAGFVRKKDTGEWFAFETTLVIKDLLWHWVLVPALQPSGDEGAIDDAFEVAEKKPDGYWLSIVEDRRVQGRAECELVMIDRRRAAPQWTRIVPKK